MAGISMFGICWAFTLNLEGVKTLFYNLGLVERTKNQEILEKKFSPNSKISEVVKLKSRNVLRGSLTLPAYATKQPVELEVVSPRVGNRLPFRRYRSRNKMQRKREMSVTLPRVLGDEKNLPAPKSILKKPSTSGDHADSDTSKPVEPIEKEEVETEIGLHNKIVFLRIDDSHVVRPGEPVRELTPESAV